MRKRRWVLAAAGAVLAAGIGVGVVVAQSGDENGGTSFLDRVARKLGIDTPKLEQALSDARSDEIDEAVTDGTLTQEQADRMKQHLDALPPGAPFFATLFGHGFKGEFHGAVSDACGLRIHAGGDGGFALAFECPEVGTVNLTDALTGYLGIDASQLAGEIAADGASLASVAEAHGKSREDLATFLQAELKARLDAAVAVGDVTQERADALLERSAESIDKMIDFPGDGARMFKGGPFPFGGFGHGGPGLGIGIGAIHERLAEFLGIDEAQLREELSADGATLASVAEAHGKSRDDLKAYIEAETKAKLDEVVGTGVLTKERADDILTKVQESVDDLIDRELPSFDGHFRGGPFEFRFEGGPFEFEFEFDGGPYRDGDGASPQEQRGELAPAFRS